MHIIVDDERAFLGMPTPCIYTRNSDHAMATLNRVWINQYLHYGLTLESLWLDHDLGEKDDIRPVVEMLSMWAESKRPLMVATINIHSMNPVGAEWCYTTLNQWYGNVNRIALPECVVV